MYRSRRFWPCSNTMKNKFALYVHWPFCHARCAYCDFRAFPYQEKRIPAYADALQKEIRLRRNETGEAVLSSLYFGGGTPSYIPLEYLSAAMQTIAAHFVLPKDREKTIELNPEDVTGPFTRAIYRMGFNRVSLGVQTFHTGLAECIGRRHTKEQAIQAVQTLQEEGFTNVSVDLMTGLPGQTKRTIAEDFALLRELNIPHLSVYALTLAEHTRMHQQFMEKPADFPDEDEERALAHFAAQEAEKIGLQRYEISNYAKEGYASQHNTSYWKLKDYIGIGLSAASYYRGSHEKNTDSLREYLQWIDRHRIPVIEREKLSNEQLYTELLLTGLRLKEGIRFSELRRRTGFSPETEKKEALVRLREGGLITFDDRRMGLTARGTDLLDTVLLELLD